MSGGDGCPWHCPATPGLGTSSRLVQAKDILFVTVQAAKWGWAVPQPSLVWMPAKREIQPGNSSPDNRQEVLCYCGTYSFQSFPLSFLFLLSSIFDVCSGVEHYVRYHLLLHTSCLPVFVQLFWAQVLISKHDSGVKWRNKSSNFKLGAALDIICWFKASLVQP